MMTFTAFRAGLGGLIRSLVIGLTAFLTVVDLFATQAILPSLARVYDVSPAAMGVAVNASTLGMAIAGLGVALFSRRIDRRRGILVSLVLLAVPTALLALAPNLTVFLVLRVIQGLFMASAFSLTLAHLGERCSAADAAGAFAAYVTGNVASNLFGRLLSASLVDHLGLELNFYVFALLNLSGAALVSMTVGSAAPMVEGRATGRPQLAIWADHLRNAPLRHAYGLGFCILFAFIGTFTYVNFVLVRPPIALDAMTLGLVYFVFLPSILTTPLAGRLAGRLGTRKAIWTSLAIAGAGLPLLLLPSLRAMVAGMVLVGIGTFLAQAIATGFVSRAATSDRGSASGIYLASYFSGGLVGSAVLGQIFDHAGWTGCVAGIAAALGCGALLAIGLRKPRMQSTMLEADGSVAVSAGRIVPPLAQRAGLPGAASFGAHITRVGRRRAPATRDKIV